MKSFDPFSEEGKAWLDYNSEEDEFGALENLGYGRTRAHSTPKRRTRKRPKKVKSYVKESDTDEQGDYVVFGGKRKKSKKNKRSRRRRRRGGTTTPKKKSTNSTTETSVPASSAVVPASGAVASGAVASNEVDVSVGPGKVPVRSNVSLRRNPYHIGIAKRGGNRRKSRKSRKSRKR